VHIEDTFAVDAPADRVFAFLLDVNSVLGCVPGAELSEMLEDGSFRGRVRVRVGPVSVAYQVTGHVVFRDDSARTAVLEAEGREAGGSGSARAVITVTVGERGEGAEVLMVTELTVVGRGAETDHGAVEEVSHGLLGQMAACIGARLAEPQLPLPTPTLSTVPDQPPTPVDRALSLARDRPVALASAGGAAAAALVVAMLLRMRGRRG
jgi:carbon monoxide dehydrogenase subunit G